MNRHRGKHGLVPLKFLSRDKNGHAFWLYKCFCDTEFKARLSNVNANLTKSCGCTSAVNSRLSLKTHGEGYGSSITKEYRAWCNMKARCLNTNNKDYDDYGGRGITIHQPWIDSYSTFLDDVGRAKEEWLTLDRIEVNGNYSPTNCRWATNATQRINRRT